MKTEISALALLAASLAVSNPLSAAVQTYVGNTNDFTPTAGTASWSLGTGSWNADGTTQTQFTSQTYSYSSNYVNTWQYITTAGTDQGYAGVGGIVFHFTSATSQAMTLAISAIYRFGNWGGHSFEVYYSDTNDWASLSSMTGGTWDGGSSWTGLESNSLWQELASDRTWGASNTYSTDTSTVTTVDGDFWIRIDFSSTDGSGGPFIQFNQLSVTGQVVPEPASLSLLALGGALLIGHRRR